MIRIVLILKKRTRKLAALILEQQLIALPQVKELRRGKEKK